MKQLLALSQKAPALSSKPSALSQKRYVQVTPDVSAIGVDCPICKLQNYGMLRGCSRFTIRLPSRTDGRVCNLLSRIWRLSSFPGGRVMCRVRVEYGRCVSVDGG